MLKKLLSKKKVYDNQAFLEQLYSKDFDVKLLTEMLESEGIDLNYQDEQEESFLHKCLKRGKYQSSIWLIDKGIDLTLKNTEGKIAFDIAVSQQNHRIVKLLLSKSQVDINERDNYGRTHLQDSVILGDHEMAEILIENGADINSKDANGRNVIFDALDYGNKSFINYLLDQEGIELNNVDIHHNTVMHHNEVLENDELAKKFIEKGAKTTLQNVHGQTYLCLTALRGMEGMDVVQTALEFGDKEDINSRSANDNTVLMELIAAASKIKDEEADRRKSLMMMAKELVFKGIDVNALDENGETALFRAVRSIDYDLVAFLLASKVDPNIINSRYETPLAAAAYLGAESIDIIIVLLQNGADPTIKNSKHHTLFEELNYAVLHTHGKRKHDDEYLLSKLRQKGQYLLVIKAMLEENRSDLTYLDSLGQPLFFTPLLYDHFQLFKLYIKAGLEVKALNASKRNVFFEYVLKVFQDDKEDIEFQNNISMLLSAKVDHNYQDETGWTVINKIIGTNCNRNLFDILTQVVLFDYTITDKLGRTVIHTAVWSDKRFVIDRINLLNPKVMNIPDHYGILPVTYAALLGNRDLVLFFIRLGSNIRSDKSISHAAIKKFHPMLKNLEKLKYNMEDSVELDKIEKLIEQVKNDFSLDNIGS